MDTCLLTSRPSRLFPNQTIQLLARYDQRSYTDSAKLNFPDGVDNRPKIPVDTGRKLNVHKTLRRRPGRLLDVLGMFNLRPVPTGIMIDRNNLMLVLFRGGMEIHGNAKLSLNGM